MARRPEPPIPARAHGRACTNAAIPRCRCTSAYARTPQHAPMSVTPGIHSPPSITQPESAWPDPPYASPSHTLLQWHGSRPYVSAPIAKPLRSVDASPAETQQRQPGAAAHRQGAADRLESRPLGMHFVSPSVALNRHASMETPKPLVTPTRQSASKVDRIWGWISAEAWTRAAMRFEWHVRNTVPICPTLAAELACWAPYSEPPAAARDRHRRSSSFEPLRCAVGQYVKWHRRWWHHGRYSRS
jgi:hypothetical protein